MAALDDEFYSQAQGGGGGVVVRLTRIDIWHERRKTTTARLSQDDADSSCLSLGWKNILGLL